MVEIEAEADQRFWWVRERYYNEERRVDFRPRSEGYDKGGYRPRQEDATGKDKKMERSKQVESYRPKGDYKEL